MSHLEIEKRYLCNAKELIKYLKRNEISHIVQKLEQFYLIAKPGETLRYRKEDNLYLKNQKFGNGLIRQESQEEITKKEYLKAKAKNSGGVIKKDRIKFIIDNYLFELDIFKGSLKGLAILEIEFKDIYSAKDFKIPSTIEPFIIKDITNESIYSNGALSRSMKIPLRSDSKLSLNDLNPNRVLKPKLDLYISDYENSKYALLNSIDRLLISFSANINYFFRYKQIRYLENANRAILKIKALIKGHKKYINRCDHDKILFNINSIILLFENAIKLQTTIKLLLNKKRKSSLKKQTAILKEIISIAQKEKIVREKIDKSSINELLLTLKKSIKNISFKDIEKPFSYLKTKVIKKSKKGVLKSLKCNSIDTIFYALYDYKVVTNYFLEEFRLKKLLKQVKKEYHNSICSNYSSYCKSKDTSKLKDKIKKAL